MSGRSPLPQASRILCSRLLRMRRAVQEVAAELADIQEHGAVLRDDVVPELAAENFSRSTTEPPPTSAAPGREHAAEV